MESMHGFGVLTRGHPRLRDRDALVVRHELTGLCFAVSTRGAQTMAFLLDGEGGIDFLEQACGATVDEVLIDLGEHLAGPSDWVRAEMESCPHCTA